MCRSTRMRHDLIGSICSHGHDLLFPERISANPLPYRFDSGFSLHTFQRPDRALSSTPSVPYNVYFPDRRNFAKFSMVSRV